MKKALWERSWRDRRGKRQGNSLEVEDGATEPVGRRDHDGSSSGEVDEGRRAVAVDDVVGEEAPAGRRTEERGVSRVLVALVYEWEGRTGGEGEPWLRDALVRNVGCVTKVPPPI